MQIRILCVGKIKEGFYRNRIQEYQKMLSKKCQFEIIEVEDEKTEEQLSEAERNRILKLEGDKLRKYLSNKNDDWIVALCIDGKQYSTNQWKQKVETIYRQQKWNQITYVIGGSLGLDSSIIQMADEKLSFSRLTFPHQLMRVMLIEQILNTYL